MKISDNLRHRQWLLMNIAMLASRPLRIHHVLTTLLVFTAGHLTTMAFHGTVTDIYMASYSITKASRKNSPLLSTRWSTLWSSEQVWLRWVLMSTALFPASCWRVNYQQTVCVHRSTAGTRASADIQNHLSLWVWYVCAYLSTVQPRLASIWHKFPSSSALR